MPELPEVETVRQGLHQLTVKQTIEGGEVLLSRTLAYPLSEAEFLQGIVDQKIASWERRGKYLLAQLQSASAQPAGWLGVHLRMTGQLLWVKQSELLQKHTRIRLFFANHQELRFVDTRTFGKVWYVPPGLQPAEIITGLQKLGPEPFAEEFSLAYFSQKLRKSRRNIKTLLLDQELVAGIGNIYADEALFKSRIRPTAIATELTDTEIKKLYVAIIEVLQAAIAKGGTTFSDFLNLLGVSGNYGDAAWVYGRGGYSCRICGNKIEKIKLNGRSAHFCPYCQINS
ncbi:DNA-(apurinic or apyrimidinic site) lyase [Stanieria cyanosphaera PCC 7437]|uniref:Formamidopyrimidine-DNA glycosylase n=1 Tax=Stanieria cyanosphaera (strain ATCC 29371 / PCC 7437) TaxID=111780 RepID=K9XZ94_STAC7|nr:DNA-formamidopyrimidine glycosylase [Stanieria cyanosphaera]AFZ37920.1 DNA-(apurinic or apyrimidinic site) lyase [Stanieria cyanosphaera PCC 7437]